MQWNWQKSDWPNFSWRRSLLAKAEEQFLIEAGTLRGILKHLAADDRQQLVVEAMSMEAITTSEIEGEFLDRASVQSSICRQLGLAAVQRGATGMEMGIAELMVDLLHSFAEPLSHKNLFRWHRMLLGSTDLKEVGCYRTGPHPMQVVSGPVHEPKVHFEAPPSSQVIAEMDRFVEWFNGSAFDGSEPLPALTRAGIAHFYFVTVHPFEDGNGRIGRAIAEKALGQNQGEPALTSLATTILIKRSAYYDALQRANKRNEITSW